MIRAVVLLSLFLSPVVDQQKSDWYQSLKQPITGASCCSEADCRPTRSTFIDGFWWVEGPRGPLKVNPAVILDREPYDGMSAVACIVGGEVYCFVMGGSGG